ncbi:MAG: 1,3-beta-galactosyl-N-acetylhexosamine phosphorylase, partial [Clostridia bacterium]|nr:1,3-beta-galactosyl-N-acetylhexosamine phosphorylase [Clostridia bacterium]
TVAELVEICHKHGKEAMMFLGDDWIGSEPYGDHFPKMGLDAVVGSVGGGVTVRMLSEIPHVKYHEGRFLPYFFPDTFFDGNEENAVAELNRNWLTARRAHMRKPLDRMGFGGYLSLAAKFPSFINRVEEIADEFRTVYEAIDNKKPYCRLKVGLLNAWGKKRSWMSHMVAHELWYQSIYSYQGILEAISGLPVDIQFLSFDEVQDGVPKDIDVLINVGDAYTAFSGGKAWLDEKLQTAIREFVYNGGGFIGVGEPTACSANGRYFQLADVLGVDEEIGYTLSVDKYNIEKVSHELTTDMQTFDYGEDKKNIYALDGAQVLDIVFSDRFKRNVNVGEVKMAVNEYGKGRSFYVTGLPYSFENARLLYKAMCYVSHKDLYVSYSSNPLTECNYYPTSGKYAVVNNSNTTQTTDFYDIDGKKTTLTLQPMEVKWL